MSSTFYKYKLLIVILFSTIFAGYFFLQLLLEFSINLLMADIIGAVCVFIYCLTIGLLHVYYNKLVKFNFNKKTWYYIVKFLATSFISILVTMLFDLIKRTLSANVLDDDVTKIVIARGVMANLCFFFIISLMDAVGNMRQYEFEILQLKKANNEAQLNQLKDQVSPHFFFNSLNTLKAMVEDNDKNSVDFIIQLSFIYRQFLKEQEEPLATLKDEIEFTKAYFSILSARFEDALVINYNVNGNCLQNKIPVFGMQVIIENIIKHNKISSTNSIIIDIFTDPENKKLVTRNSIVAKNKTEDSHKIGLSNIKSRYKLLNIAGFNYFSKDNFFTVEMPLI